MQQDQPHVWAMQAELGAYKECFTLAMQALEVAWTIAGSELQGLPVESLELRLKQLRGEALTVAPPGASTELQTVANQAYRATQEALMARILAAAKGPAQSG